MTTIFREFCLGSACYTFTIADEFGDGICCTQGDGGYTITSAFGPHVESDGQYSDGETHEFCLVGVGLPETFPGTIAVFPNPASGQVDVLLPSPTTSATSWELHDMLGRRIANGSMAAGQQRARIDLGVFANGSYLLRCSVDGSLMTNTIFVRH